VHIFSDIQRWYRQRLDSLIVGSDKEIQLAQTKDNLESQRRM